MKIANSPQQKAQAENQKKIFSVEKQCAFAFFIFRKKEKAETDA